MLGYVVSILPLDVGAALNASGAIVGQVGGRGVYYSQGVTTVLAVPPGFSRVEPVDLADDGKIITLGRTAQGPRAVLYLSPSGPGIDISAPRWAEPYSMNNQGVVVGRYGPYSWGWGAFRWTPSTGLIDITPTHLGYEFGWPLHVSESGYIIGWVQAGNTVRDARWSPLAIVTIMPDNFAVGYSSQALENGNVLGSAASIGSAIWSPSGITSVGPDPANMPVRKISPLSRLIGTYSNNGQPGAWTSYQGSVTYLPLPAGFQLAYVNDVNRCGTILGNGRDQSNLRRAIVWTKVSCDVAQPPIGW